MAVHMGYSVKIKCFLESNNLSWPKCEIIKLDINDDIKSGEWYNISIFDTLVKIFRIYIFYSYIFYFHLLWRWTFIKSRLVFRSLCMRTITLNFWSSSCLHHLMLWLCVDADAHTVSCWGLNQWLHECWTITLPTELYHQVSFALALKCGF